MLDLTTIQARLVAQAANLQQVILPDLEDVQSVDSATKLVPILDSVVAGNSYPIILPNDITYPSAIYELTGSDRVEEYGYPILRSDQYLIGLQDSTYGSCSSTAKSLRTALQDYAPAGEAGTIDILDQSDSYDVDFELFEHVMLLRMIHLARSVQTLPAAFVFHIDEGFLGGEEITCVNGFAEARFSVLLVIKIPAGGTSGISETREQIVSALAGWQPTGWSKIEPQGGTVVSVHSKIVLWRDEFSCVQERTYP